MALDSQRVCSRRGLPYTSTKRSLIILLSIIYLIFNRAHAGFVNMAGFSLEAYPRALCLDGTPAKYYHKTGIGEGSNKWYIEMQGGGWCDSNEKCIKRFATQWGSSINWPETMSKHSPFYSDDSTENPLMHDWNKIYFRYCDGFSFSGNLQDPIDMNGTLIYSRGNDILEAGITDMLDNRNLSEAVDVIVGGCSAGGLATLMRCDRWAERIREYSADAKVSCTPESGFFRSYNGTSGPMYHNLMINGMQLHSPVLHPKCTENEADQSKCVFAEHLVKYVKSPIFLMQSMYDSWGGGVIALSNNNSEVINQFGAELAESIFENMLTNSVSNATHGLFLDSCARHCGGYKIEISGMKKTEALKQWYERETRSSNNDDVHFQGESYVCEECCTASVLPAHRSQVGQTLYSNPAFVNQTKVEFGTSVALSAARGSRLVVGAPFYDRDITGSENPGGGGIFLFDYNGLNWNPSWSFFGNAGENLGKRVSISADGTRIAVRRYNSNPSYGEVYDIDPTGIPTQIGGSIMGVSKGDTITLSPNGKRVALSNENFNRSTGRVEIFELENGVWTNMVNSNMSIFDGVDNQDRFGWTTAFSNSGNRIAISSPNYNGGLSRRGFVGIYDYDGTWSLTGNLEGSTSNDQFGFSMDLSGDGSTLVVGSPGSEADGSIRGKIGVYKFDSGNWTLQSEIWGSNGTNSDRFGRSVAISDNGSRIAGSSYFHDQQRGHIRLFDLSETSLVQVGSAFVGEAPFDRFGFGVSSVTMTGDGLWLASGSVWAENMDGHTTGSVRVFKEGATPTVDLNPSPSSTPSIASFEPTVVPSVSSSISSTQSATPTVEPTRAPSSAFSIASFGPSAVPFASTSIPSTLSASPIMSVTPSPTLTLPVDDSLPVSNPPSTHSPTLPPTLFPTITSSPTSPSENLDKFSWKIEKLGSAIFAFNSVSSSQEIQLRYNISRRVTTFSVYEQDCTTEVPSNVVTISESLFPSSPRDALLFVSLDIKQDAVMGSNIWSQSATDVAFVDICVRLDLLLDDAENVSVHFDETQISLTIDMTCGFQATEIELGRVSAEIITEEVSTDYEVIACHCDGSFTCLNETVIQGSDVFICLETNFAEIKVAAVESVNFVQGPLSMSPIVAGAESYLTTVDFLGNKCSIRTQLTSGFFSNANPSDILVDGVVVLTFANSGTGRRLRTAFSSQRTLQGLTGFDVNLGVAPPSDHSSVPCKRTSTSMAVSLAVSIFWGASIFA